MIFCWGCKHLKPLAYTDVLARAFCPECAVLADGGGLTAQDGREFLRVTVPFEVGDHVECRLAGERYEGTGKITTVSMDYHDGGTPVMPIFHVVFDEPGRGGKPDAWLCERDLQKVS